MSAFFARRSQLPGTHLNVSFATVGTMMFGKRADEAESKRIVDVALDRGINFFDTASMYQYGESERILGRLVKDRRDECVIATKVGVGKDDDGNLEGLSPKALRRAIDKSLADLGLDTVDIWYFHVPDREVPIEESLSTMAEIIAAGKARYFGLSNFGAWQCEEILGLCAQHDWPQPVISQMIYNPLMRQIEYEYTRFVESREMFLTVYNPLAGGLLTGKYASLADDRKGGRFSEDNAMYRNRYWSKRFMDGMLALKQIADDEGMSLTHLSLLWVARQPFVHNILLGPSNVQQFEDCLAAGESELTDAALERITLCLDEFEGTDASYAR